MEKPIYEAVKKSSFRSFFVFLFLSKNLKILKYKHRIFCMRNPVKRMNINIYIGINITIYS